MMEQAAPHAPADAAPLAGWRIVITRSADRAEGFVARLREFGAEPIIYPTIAFAPPDDLATFDTALAQIQSGGYDWLVLTSVTAVQFVQARLAESGQSVQSAHQRPALAAVGPSTATACAALLGVQPAVVPEKFVAESLAAALCGSGDPARGLQGQRVLLANADIARPTLEEMLQAAGASVDRVIAYCTVPATGGVDLPPLLAAGQIDAITFTSGSTARYFVQRIGPEALAYAQRTVIACIGPVTARVATAAGLPPTVVADTYSEAGLIDALVAFARGR